jgi:UDP-2,3-diacylglucosamine pyrophosphatase LpxH
MSKILVTSDQHLGYGNSCVNDFKRFLDYISSTRDDVDSFVILGDFVDMWRRDASGLFLEHSDIVNKLLSLRSIGIRIYI